ncbi:hypothetical protein BURMUCF2_1547 [Burkholderia multivorans CF2]|nr:hypothetical protein BURMUCF2_1547 [Burkholderia multivorans CF2]
MTVTGAERSSASDMPASSKSARRRRHAAAWRSPVSPSRMVRVVR